MKQLIKIEVKRAFTGIWMKVTLGIGLFLALSHFLFQVVPLDLLKGYNQYIASSVPRNLLENWMAGSTSVENEIYKYIVYLLVALPFGASYYEDCRFGSFHIFVCEKHFYSAYSTFYYMYFDQ